MKLRILGTLSALLLLVASCSENENPGANAYGGINPTIKANNAVQKSRPLSRDGESQAFTPDLNQFSMKVSKKDGTFSKTWDTLEKFDPSEQFVTGNYKVEAFYGAIDEEGFEKPYYYGSADVNVLDEETAEPQIEATLANTMVTINYTDAFKKYFSAYKTTIHSDGGEYIDFEKDETRAAYVRPGNIELELALTKTNGVSFTFNPASIENALPRTHYSVTFDVNGGEVGDANLVITFDEATEVEPISIELSDELIYAPAPYLTTKGYVDGQELPVVDGASAGEVKSSIIAMAGLKELNLTTSSEYLLSQGWPAEINLLAATEEQKALLQKFGLKVAGLWKNPDKMAIVDFSDLIPNLKEQGDSKLHAFTIQVKDKYTKVSEPVVLKILSAELEVSISSPQTLEIGQTSETVKMHYNGSDLAKHVKMMLLNESGTWENCAISNVVSLGNQEYNVTFTIPVSIKDIKVKATCGNSVESEELSIPRANAKYAVSANDYNVWNTKATINVNPTIATQKSIITELATVYVKKGTGSYAVDTNISKDVANGQITINGLSANTAYTVKISYNNGTTFSDEYTFTTEAETQLENAGMESWYTVGSGSYWWNYGCGANANTIWGTLNPKTTASGSGYSYCKPSGTLSTNDKHSGSNAALIRTVGYGSGNTAGGSASIVNNVASGELYLGKYDGGAKYGIEFKSRPTALEFYYKYTPTTKVSGDYLVAEIVVMDAAGNQIGKGTFTNTAKVATYTKASVKVNYTKLAKAAKMYVLFKSSGNSSCISRSALTLPGFGLGYEKFVTVGSQLFVDDIALKY